MYFDAAATQGIPVTFVVIPDVTGGDLSVEVVITPGLFGDRNEVSLEDWFIAMMCCLF